MNLKYLLVLAIAGALLVAGVDLIINPSRFKPEPTTTYEGISVNNAITLLNTEDVHVIDVRGLEGCGECEFNKGHLPNAFLYDNPEELYRLKNTLLIYSTDGVMGEWFCEQLMGNVYGKVYNLEGGWDAWRNTYFPQ